MSVIIGSREAFETVTSAKNKTVLVDFYADWCGPCRMLSPILEEIEKEYDDVVVAKLNIDDHMDMAMDFKVNAVPYVLIYRDDKELGDFLGLKSKEDILSLIGKA